MKPTKSRPGAHEDSAALATTRRPAVSSVAVAIAIAMLRRRLRLSCRITWLPSSLACGWWVRRRLRRTHLELLENVDQEVLTMFAVPVIDAIGGPLPSGKQPPDCGTNDRCAVNVADNPALVFNVPWTTTAAPTRLKVNGLVVRFTPVAVLVPPVMLPPPCPSAHVSCVPGAVPSALPFAVTLAQVPLTAEVPSHVMVVALNANASVLVAADVPCGPGLVVTLPWTTHVPALAALAVTAPTAPP